MEESGCVEDQHIDVVLKLLMLEQKVDLKNLQYLHQAILEN